jgi:RNA polymerase sigma-70 factor (ECF subfamily)
VASDQTEQQTQESTAAPVQTPDVAWTDSQLLEAFVLRRDETAFATLVTRHGRMVWQICCRQLFCLEDAEDAFQATFLVLAQRAASIGRRELLANWLHGVANRVVQRARIVASKRRAREGQSLELGEEVPAPAEIDPNVKRVIQEEINHLPAKYRAPVLLCYLQSRTHEEAARELRCPVGTVKGRLSRALDLLRSRLVRRGLALSAGVVASALSHNAAEATVSAALLERTVRFGSPPASGSAAVEPVISHQVTALSERIGSPRGLGRLGQLACGVMVLFLIGGVIFWFSGGQGMVRFGGTRGLAGAGAAEGTTKEPVPPDDKALLEGTWKPVSVLLAGKEAEGQPENLRFVFAGDRITALMGGQVAAEYTFKVDPDQKPKTIDMTLITGPMKGKEFPSLYELNGDVLKVCMPGPDPDQRPVEMASTPVNGVTLITLQRERK